MAEFELNLSMEELEKIRLHKRELRGGFDKKIYLRKD